MNTERRFNTTIEQAWHSFKKNLFTLIGASFLKWITLFGLMFAIGGMIVGLGRFFSIGTLLRNNLVLPIGFSLVLLFFMCLIWLSLGFIDIALKITRQQQPHISDLFGQFNKVLPAFIGYAIYWAVVCIGILALLIPGIYMALRWYFFPYVLVDKNVSLVQALKRSSEITKGMKFSLFIYIILMSWLLMIPVLNFLVHIINILILAYIYRIADQPRNHNNAPITHHENIQDTQEMHND
ncbi:MAG: hypothetical protein ACOYT8_04615 [Candidatus Dependentiae bacterium]